MKCIWTEHEDEIKKLECEFCDSEEIQLYEFNDSIWCEACLRDEPAEQEESYNQVCAERNK